MLRKLFQKQRYITVMIVSQYDGIKFNENFLENFAPAGDGAALQLGDSTSKSCCDASRTCVSPTTK
jgi:hypothetical protein